MLFAFSRIIYIVRYPCYFGQTIIELLYLPDRDYITLLI